MSRDLSLPSVAYVFPGQGAQKVGMGRDLWEALPWARERFRLAEDLTGISLAEVVLRGPEAELTETVVLQPALFLVETLLFDALRDLGAPPPVVVAGHSLGEYAALYAAGVLDFAQGIRLTHARGLAMAEAARQNPGTMAAVVGLSPEVVESVCREVSALGEAFGVEAANLNSPEQVVISGRAAGVEEASRRLLALGARRVVPLRVAGPFHSSYMATAQKELGRVLREVALREPSVPVLVNAWARPVRSAAELREALLEQLVRPVRWVDTVRALRALGVETIVEVGPGSVLTGLVRETDPGFSLYNVASLAGAQVVAGRLRSASDVEEDA
ncbi:MAG: ACP S-malonyltransferase [Brockia lithotrophica]|nr:ACP S-malonyltransferase [Brockia lithotrophica]